MGSAIRDMKLQVDRSSQVTAGVFKIKAQNDVNIGTSGPTSRPATIVEEIEVLRSSLKIEYKTVGSRMARLPWIEHDPLKDFYVNLTFQTKNWSGKYVDNKNLRFEDIFSGSPSRVILVAGAGYGKTTLLTNIAQVWAKDECSSFKHFQTVVLLKLRDMAKGEGCREFLQKFCQSRLSYDFPELDLNIFLRDGLRKSLVLLDGFDELSCEDQSSVKAFLDINPPVFHGTILMTTRPGVHSAILKLFDRVIAIPELSETMQTELIDRTFTREPKQADQVKLFLKRCVSSLQTGMSPLLLYAICFVFKTADANNVDNTEDLLYVVIKTLLRRTAERLSLCIEESAIENIVLSLGELFYIKLQERKIKITNSELEAVCGNSYHIVKKMEIFSNVENEEMEIIHSLLMEVLSVRYLNNLFSKFKRNENTRHFLLNFLGDRYLVRTYLLFQHTPAVVLKGTLSEIVYEVKNEHSILNGRFKLSQELNLLLNQTVLYRFLQSASNPMIPYLWLRTPQNRWNKTIFNWKRNIVSNSSMVTPSVKSFGQIEIKNSTIKRLFSPKTLVFRKYEIWNMGSFVDEMYETEENKNWSAIFEEILTYSIDYEMKVTILH